MHCFVTICITICLYNVTIRLYRTRSENTGKHFQFCWFIMESAKSTEKHTLLSLAYTCIGMTHNLKKRAKYKSPLIITHVFKFCRVVLCPIITAGFWMAFQRYDRTSMGQWYNWGSAKVLFPNYFIGPLVCWSHAGSIVHVHVHVPSKCLMARGRLVGIAKISCRRSGKYHRYIPCLLCGIPSQSVFRYSDKIDCGSASNDFAAMCTVHTVHRAMAALMMTS